VRMKTISLRDLVIGEVLGQDAYGPQGQLLLTRGTLLRASHIQRLRALGIEEVAVGLDAAPPGAAASRGALAAQDAKSQAFSRAFDAGQAVVREFMERVAAGRPVDSAEARESIDLIYPQVVASHNVLRQLGQLRSKDEYTLQHSVAVSIMGVKIGQLLGLAEPELKEVGLAGLLHDVGKCRIPSAILNKPGRLTAEEFAEMKKHAVYGYQAMKAMGLGASAVALAVLQHHEREDGSGYPLKLPSPRLHLYAKILAVADCFDAMTSDRVYSPRKPALLAAQEILREVGSTLDAAVTRRFVQYVVDLAVGSQARLSNGEAGTIVLVDPEEPARPLVQVQRRFIDLRQRRDLVLEDVRLQTESRGR
jgi:HD-GYP domain-containing protein (c-di-GMP phosphodiesterase class II)